jgi:thiosulfate dehydrogenase (quinone) large subunit
MFITPTIFLILRFALAASMFTHGFVRIPKLAKFSAGMVESFETSMLPKFLVLPFSYGLPFAEFIIGVLLILGLFTRQALIAGGFMMVMLIFGSGMIEKWDSMPSQLIHVLFFAILLSAIQNNTFAMDKLLKK